MPFSDDLIAGVAQYLAAAGGFTWRSTGAYLPTDPVPLFNTSMPATPDRAVALAYYGVSSDASLSDSVIGLQARIRGAKDGDPRTANAIADAIFDRLHGAHGVDLSGGIRLVLAEHRSGTPLGVDTSGGRHQRTENYYLTVHRPSLHRT